MSNGLFGKKYPRAGINYCQQRNKGSHEKNHRDRDLGLTKTYCQDTLNNTSCFCLLVWFT